MDWDLFSRVAESMVEAITSVQDAAYHFSEISDMLNDR